MIAVTDVARERRRPRVLFVADAVTLAHLARPVALARAIDPERFEVHLAADPRFARFLGPLSCALHELETMPSDRFLDNVARGRPLYDAATLRAYVAADLALLEGLRPDVVVGDHRLSLSVSARLAGVPYLSLVNAYWSPYTPTRRLPMPELPIGRVLPSALAAWLFRAVWPVASALQCRPLNRVRAEHGLAGLGNDWFSVYADADRTLYVDAAELVPTVDLPPSHTCIGPVSWSPAVPLPEWWDALPDDRPLVYVTLGSSGRAELLDVVLQALAGLDVLVMVTTAGKAIPRSVPSNARLVDFAPGERLAARADLMICNGGSLTVYQALAEGKPVLGIAAHMDQQLSMSYVESAGVGVCVRSDSLSIAGLRARVRDLLDDSAIHLRAREMGRSIAGYDPVARLTAVVDEVLRG